MRGAPAEGDGGGLRGEVERRLRLLVADPATAGAASDWAREVMEGEAPELDDAVVWDALDQLLGSDLLVAPATPLHGPADHAAWLAAFLAGRRGPGPPGSAEFGAGAWAEGGDQGQAEQGDADAAGRLEE
ncbi:hypothetical protein [Streptomyces sedi]|uniref:hypothetical protein n=1 Tax=Streptomyces sedi TaxID=555059 RepID=UPI001B88348D|nr:hypothetical protein [Streptomyces sedi]